ncbi:MAG: response regulator [Verrucomicrobia bacterium]|nr:response regulator [Verrucomicrobiota bacterium]
MRFLIVDRSSIMRWCLKSYLDQIGFESIEALDGEEALTKLSTEGPFHGAIVNWDMPGMNGIEFIRTVRSNALTSALKLVMLTERNDVESAIQAFRAGADGYLTKPVTLDMIEDILNRTTRTNSVDRHHQTPNPDPRP